MTVPSNISDINNLYTFCKYCRQITVNITASASPLQSLSKAFFFYVMHTRTHPIYMKKKKRHYPEAVYSHKATSAK